MRYISLTICCALALLLSACGAAPTGGAPPATTPAATAVAPAASTTPPAPTNAPAATPQPTAAATSAPAVTTVPAAATAAAGDSSGVLVTYHKSGGIAGIDDTLTIHGDGTLELRSRRGDKTTQVTAADLAQLEKLIASPEFAALKPLHQVAGADMITYEVTVGGQTVATMDGAQTPPALAQVIEELERLMERVES